ncbi:MAG TPA: PAS domain S-box protein, partial [Fibrobacteria bacterium]|nr:PAS domain S-box protein [Fibrobacteria bacterium]
MRVGGPFLTLILAGLIEFLRDSPLRITNPPAFFVLVIVFAGFSSGLIPSIISAMLAWAYTAYFFSGPGVFEFTEDNLRRVAVWSVVMPLIAWMVGVLNRRTATAMAQAKLGALERTRWEERARAQEELGRSEAYLAEAQKLAHAGSWAWNVGTREFVHCSQEFYRLHGLDPSAGIPSWETMQRQIHPEDREYCNEQLDRAIRERTECVMEFRCILPDGSTRIIQSISHPVLGQDGAPVEFVGTEIDITDRKRAEELLRESEARFRTFVDHAADAFFLLDYDSEGRILDVNRQACEGLGYSREELIGKTALEIDTWLTPDDLNRIGERVKSGEVFAFETHFCRKDKTDFPVEVHIRPFLHGGRRLGVSLARDITERKQAEKALNESHDLLRAVVEGTPDPIFAMDLQGRCRLINSAGARFLGRTVEEVLGKDYTELLPTDAAQGIRERDLRILETGEMETFEETVTSASGTRTYLSTKSPYRDRHGNVIGLVGIARDITELK